MGTIIDGCIEQQKTKTKHPLDGISEESKLMKDYKEQWSYRFKNLKENKITQFEFNKQTDELRSTFISQVRLVQDGKLCQYCCELKTNCQCQNAITM